MTTSRQLLSTSAILVVIAAAAVPGMDHRMPPAEDLATAINFLDATPAGEQLP